MIPHALAGLLLLATGTACEAQDSGTAMSADPAGGKADTAGSDAEMRPTSNGNAELLQAWDPLLEKTSPNFCVEFVDEPDFWIGEREDSYDVSYVSSREELASKLSVDIALKAEVRGVNADAKLKLVNEFNSSANVMSYLVRLTSQFAVRPRGELRMTEVGLEASESGADAFARRCGTHYVRAIRYGTELYLLISLSAADESNSAELEAELSAGGSLAGQALEGSFGSKLSEVASRSDVNVSIELASRGFALPTAEGEGEVLAELTAGDVSQRMFDAIQRVREAMVESTAADIGVLKNPPEGMVQLNAVPTAISASLYSGLYNWVGLPETGPSYMDVIELARDKETYLRELGALMDRMSGIYYAEVLPFLEAQGAQRATYQTRDGLEPLDATAELMELATRSADEFRPPSSASSIVGETYALAERAYGDCWLASGENPLHDCLDAAPWDDHAYVDAQLEAYHEARVIPMRYWAGDEALANYSNAAEACQEREFSARFGGGRGRLPTKEEAESMVNLIAAGPFDWTDADLTHAIYYRTSDEDGEQCDNACFGAGAKMLMTVTPDREIDFVCSCDSWFLGDEALPVCVPPDGPRILPAAP
ncbi:MAG: hypothetical protein AAGA54_23365 [Myxococcota bacterium]